uniref:protein-disulfide reductase n=1 Tax=Caenorhabditis tropicalis TaxID=1561998 RepID=A0A1I7TDX5_9PELO
MSEFMKGVMLLKQDLTEVPAEEALKGKVSCTRFYHHLKKAGKPIEVVFFSRDRSKADLEENFTEKHGDWLCVKYGDDILARYQSKFEVKTIPVLRVINPAGKMVVLDGKSEVVDKGKADPLGLFASWEAACNKK